MKTIKVVAGDIGGTKTALRLVEIAPDGNAAQRTTLGARLYASEEHEGLTPLVRSFLSEHAGKSSRRPDVGCFAVAGHVEGRTSKVTNLSWTVDADELERELEIPSVALLNDFGAIAWGVDALTSKDIVTLQEGVPDDEAPLAVIGAGTGLGQGFALRAGGRLHVFPSEGGHADFAPRTPLESELAGYAAEKLGGRVSVERLVSGPGIPLIYMFLRDVKKERESRDLASIVSLWETEPKGERTQDAAASISRFAGEGEPLARRVMHIFGELYGAEAGNMALRFLPYSGLYVAGGIAAKNLSFMTDGGFLTAFRDKGRMSRVAEKIPLRLVRNLEVGLMGAVTCAEQVAAGQVRVGHKA